MPAIILFISFVIAIAAGLWDIALVLGIPFGLYIYFACLVFRKDPKRRR